MQFIWWWYPHNCRRLNMLVNQNYWYKMDWMMSSLVQCTIIVHQFQDLVVYLSSLIFYLYVQLWFEQTYSHQGYSHVFNGHCHQSRRLSVTTSHFLENSLKYTKSNIFSFDCLNLLMRIFFFLRHITMYSKFQFLETSVWLSCFTYLYFVC